jgi:hypothetical protein
VTTHNDNIETVKQLKARYVRSLNTMVREVLQHLFVVDAVVDMHAEGVGETRTAEEFVESMVRHRRGDDGAPWPHPAKSHLLRPPPPPASGPWKTNGGGPKAHRYGTSMGSVTATKRTSR